MTLAKAKTVISALLDLGLAPQIVQSGAVYTIVVDAPNGAPSASVDGFAVAQGVTGTIFVAKFV